MLLKKSAAHVFCMSRCVSVYLWSRSPGLADDAGTVLDSCWAHVCHSCELVTHHCYSELMQGSYANGLFCWEMQTHLLYSFQRSLTYSPSIVIGSADFVIDAPNTSSRGEGRTVWRLCIPSQWHISSHAVQGLDVFSNPSCWLWQCA